METMKLRPYQQEIVDLTRQAIASGKRRPLIALPTGGGKSIVIGQIIKLALEKGSTCLFLVHRRNLVTQFRDTLSQHFDIDAGVIMAGYEFDAGKKVYLATIQTYSRRINLERLDFNQFYIDADLVFVDECLHPKTEILTEDGWVPIPDLKRGVRVAQYDHQNQDINFEYPTKYIKKKCSSGFLYKIKNRAINLMATGGHLQPHRGATGKIKKSKVADLPGWLQVPKSGYAIGDGITELSWWEKFCIMASADGCVIKKHREGWEFVQVQFQLSKERKIRGLLEIVEKCGFKYSETKPSPARANVNSRRRFCVVVPGNFLKGVHRIKAIKDVNYKWCQQFISELVEWDGSTKGVVYFSTTNNEEADYVQAISALSGISCHRSVQVDNRKESYKDVHRFFFKFDTHGGGQRVKKEKIPYSGDVYCVRVPKGNIVTRLDNCVVITGNCHLAISPTYQKVFNLHSKRILIGCTATPCRSDGRGLGEVFDALVSVIDTGKLTEMGFLSPVRYFAPSTPDLAKLKIRLGDYEKKGLADRMDKPKIIGDVVENWLKLAEGRKTMVFAVNVKHSRHIRDEFLRVGVPAIHIDAKTSDDEREYAFNALERGDIKVITNVAVYQEGIDVPDISCICMARPTKSLALYRQCGGRGLRISEGKGDLLFLDFGGVVEEHGFLTDEIEWTLDGKEKAFHKKKKKESEPKIVKCSSCGLIYQGESRCPDCGSKPESFGKAVKYVDAELQEINPKKNNRVISWADKRIVAGALTWYAQKKGYKSGWVAHSYRDLFGVWPNDRRVKNVPPIKPEGVGERMLQHLLIKRYHEFKKNVY